MVIVVTGGIGSGKSEVCRMISSRYGFPVYSADSRVRRLYDEVPELVDALESVLDIVLRDDSGLFRPALLAERIFSDHEALKKVEDMVFPYLISDFEDFHSKNPGNVVFESATVLEKEFFSDFGDAVVLVDAPLEVRVGRACSRDASDRDRILARTDAQPLMNAFSDGSISRYPEDTPYGRASGRVTYIIKNDGSLEMLEKEVSAAVESILDAKRLPDDQVPATNKEQ